MLTPYKSNELTIVFNTLSFKHFEIYICICLKFSKAKYIFWLFKLKSSFSPFKTPFYNLKNLQDGVFSNIKSWWLFFS